VPLFVPLFFILQLSCLAATLTPAIWLFFTPPFSFHSILSRHYFASAMPLISCCFSLDAGAMPSRLPRRHAPMPDEFTAATPPRSTAFFRQSATIMPRYRSACHRAAIFSIAARRCRADIVVFQAGTSAAVPRQLCHHSEREFRCRPLRFRRRWHDAAPPPDFLSFPFFSSRPPPSRRPTR